jgi:hypothetical protein
MLSLVACSVIPVSSFGIIVFEKTYGGVYSDVGYCVQQVTDGGYVVAGVYNSHSPENSDVYLIRTDSLGEVLWERTYGGSLSDAGYSVRQTGDRGYIIGGYTRSFGAGGEPDFYLIRTDSVGNVLWDSAYGGVALDYCHSARQTRDGGYIAAGLSSSFPDPFAIYVIRTDSVGALLWEIAYGVRSYLYNGCSVEQTEDGGYIIGGMSFSGDPAFNDVCLIKMDSLGSETWRGSYDNSVNDFGCSARQTKDSGYVITGWTGPSGNPDAYLLKTDSLGTVLWERTYGQEGTHHGYCVRQTTDGGYVIVGDAKLVGSEWYSVCLVKTDSLGQLQWKRAHGGFWPDQGYYVEQTEDGGYIVAGATRSFGAGGDDVYLIKTDENGLTGVEEMRKRFFVIHQSFQLLQNHPNPFSRSTAISYTLPAATQVTLAIYDITGRLVETLVNETQQPGVHQVQWNRDSNPSGVYFYCLKAGEFGETRKMVVVE